MKKQTTTTTINIPALQSQIETLNAKLQPINDNLVVLDTEIFEYKNNSNAQLSNILNDMKNVLGLSSDTILRFEMNSNGFCYIYIENQSNLEEGTKQRASEITIDLKNFDEYRVGRENSDMQTFNTEEAIYEVRFQSRINNSNANTQEIDASILFGYIATELKTFNNGTNTDTFLDIFSSYMSDMYTKTDRIREIERTTYPIQHEIGKINKVISEHNASVQRELDTIDLNNRMGNILELREAKDGERIIGLDGRGTSNIGGLFSGYNYKYAKITKVSDKTVSIELGHVNNSFGDNRFNVYETKRVKISDMIEAMQYIVEAPMTFQGGIAN